MKKAITLSLIVFLLSPILSRAGSAIFNYDDFGPQVAVYELIGFQWWQWESHGDPNPSSKPDIRVIVYWDEALDDIKTQYPVDQRKQLDYRYLEYDKAIKNLENLIQEFENSGMKADDLRATLDKLKKVRICNNPAN